MISLPIRSTALRFCSALLGVAALALPVQAAELTPGKISSFSLSESYVDTLKTFRDGPKTWTQVVNTSKTTIKLTLDLGRLDEEVYEYVPLDLSTLNEETPFSISVGSVVWEGHLGDDPAYTPGKKSVFIPANVDEETGDAIGTNGIKLSWTGTKLTVSILRSGDDGDEKSSIWAESLKGLHSKAQTSTRLGQKSLSVAFGDNSSTDYYYLGEDGEAPLPAYLTASIKTTAKAVSEENILLDSITVTGGIDTTPPTITLTPPKGGFPIKDGMVTISGKVSDKHGLFGVYSYDGLEEFESALLTYTKGDPKTVPEGWWGPVEATWSLVLPVEIGVNQFEFSAEDQSGHYKSISTEVFQTIPAQFLGRWDALLNEGGGGFLTLTVSPKGAVSGKINLQGGVSKSFKGIWHGEHFHAYADKDKSTEIYISAYIPTEDARSASAALAAAPLPQMVAEVEYYAGEFFAKGPAIRIPYSSANKLAAESPLVGRFNAAFSGGSELKLGSSFFSMVSTNTGAVTVAGRLADGTTFTSAAGLGENGEIPFFSPLYKTGYVSSFQQIDTEISGLREAVVNWARPENFSDKQFPGGFKLEIGSFGSLYTPPETDSRILGLSSDNALATWEGDQTSEEGVERAILVTTKHKITAPSDSSFNAKVDPKTGLITGSFKLSTTPALTATYSALAVDGTAEGFYVAPAVKGSTEKSFGEFTISGAKK